MTNTSSTATTHLILSLALPFGAAMVFAVLVYLVPVQPMAPEMVFMFLGGAAVLGIVGPAMGRLMRAKIGQPETLQAYLRQSLTPTLVSLAIREAGVIMAALYVHFGGVAIRGIAVAGVIILTMLIDVRTPGRVRAEYELLTGRRA
ncbi:MAG: hypothetical protein ACAI38_25990 [Myxococcota bacterium]|nr:hypothetical protein [Myxococcota bacterium]